MKYLFKTKDMDQGDFLEFRSEIEAMKYINTVQDPDYALIKVGPNYYYITGRTWYSQRYDWNEVEEVLKARGLIYP